MMRNRRVEPKGLARRGVEPGSSPGTGGGGGGHGRLHGPAQAQAETVESLGQLALSGSRRHWDSQVVRPGCEQ